MPPPQVEARPLAMPVGGKKWLGQMVCAQAANEAQTLMPYEKNMWYCHGVHHAVHPPGVLATMCSYMCDVCAWQGLATPATAAGR